MSKLSIKSSCCVFVVCCKVGFGFFMLVNGSPSFSAWFCDDVMMATLFLFQLLSTVFQTDVRARGVCKENQEVLGHCFHVFVSYCDTRAHNATLYHSSQTLTETWTSAAYP